MLSFCLQLNSSSLLLYVFPSSGNIFLKHYPVLQLPLLLNMCSRRILLVSVKSSNFPYYFYHVPPIFIDSYIIYFGASTSPIPSFVGDGKYVLSSNFHMMGGICKELFFWYFLINFFFGWLQNLTSVTFGWMFKHSLHYAIIVADDDINDKKAII